jgi:hypothetical protein
MELLYTDLEIEFIDKNATMDASALLYHCLPMPGRALYEIIQRCAKELYTSNNEGPNTTTVTTDTVRPLKRVLFVVEWKGKDQAPAFVTGDDPERRELHLNLTYIQNHYENQRRSTSGSMQLKDLLAQLCLSTTSSSLPSSTKSAIPTNLPLLQGASSTGALEATRKEILGVLHHEATHLIQFDGHHGASWGLIEGIADYVRLRTNNVPPHWTRGLEDRRAKWDAGYSTTAYFLDWLCQRYPSENGGPNLVQQVNRVLSQPIPSDLDVIFQITHQPTEALWAIYVKEFQ